MKIIRRILRLTTPAAPMRIHLIAASGLWSVTGLGLLLAGLFWIQRSEGPVAIPALGVGLGVGWVKSRFVLDRAARRIAGRIESRGDGRCLGGVLSWRSWGLVLGFSLGGRLLRASPLPTSVLGAIYCAVGVGLFVSSLRIWMRWWRSRPSASR